ncbi:MAG: efflux RND transporter periplasmic adaptor subunit [Gammaproteobacteria bacterium]|nr:efflux RND transporter periplasmic adaptor subunit [Gammaproteobacteria bacterium]MBU2182040.1 efflux RND transporter periplasmic adaptor subunit [Gammaproteobacteria bacterium]MBU2203883.1 efflux RND transporter periplasmic adaptor subunit [Gammaproteobacteria bacterium]
MSMRWPIFAAVLFALVATPVTANDAVPVRVVMPQQQALSQQLVLSGSLTAQQDASLSSRIAGLVAQVLVDAGSLVSQGQALLQLDTSLAQHELAQRRAALNAARVQQAEAQRLVDEARQLTQQQLFPQTELSLRQAALARADAELQQASAALALQQEILARHTLTAPFAGVIVRRYTDSGEWLALGAPVLQLVSLTPLLLDVQVPQEYFAALPALQRLEVRSDLQPEQSLSAQLVAAVPVADASARSFLARLQVNDPQHALLPGSSATASLYFARDDASVLVIPSDALLRHPDGNFSVFSIRDNTAQRHNVKLGRVSAQGVEVLSGLPAEQPVVIRGNETLRDGQPVRILSDDTSSAPRDSKE